VIWQRNVLPLSSGWESEPSMIKVVLMLGRKPKARVKGRQMRDGGTKKFITFFTKF
jgi:hypothetical protein